MGTKSAGLGFYEFLIEAELQQYYSPFKNELKVIYFGFSTLLLSNLITVHKIMVRY